MRNVCYHLKYIDLGIVPAANPKGKRHIFTCRNSPNEKIYTSQDSQIHDGAHTEGGRKDLTLNTTQIF
jgi:hypothetical protein